MLVRKWEIKNYDEYLECETYLMNHELNKYFKDYGAHYPIQENDKESDFTILLKNGSIFKAKLIPISLVEYFNKKYRKNISYKYFTLSECIQGFGLSYKDENIAFISNKLLLNEQIKILKTNVKFYKNYN